MRYGGLQRLLPKPIHRYVLDFEARIEAAVADFSASLPDGSRVLDAGAGESRHAADFGQHRYIAMDLAVGDAEWDYSQLDCMGDLESMPFADDAFDACLNIVTLEHVREPGKVVAELVRILAPGGRLLVIVPHAWEVHQAPNDYFRYTRHGIRYLLEQAGCRDIRIRPMGGYFRLLSRRLLNGLQFFPPVLFPFIALAIAPAVMLLPLFDCIDREKNFTLGYVCTAQKPS